MNRNDVDNGQALYRVQPDADNDVGVRLEEWVVERATPMQLKVRLVRRDEIESRLHPADNWDRKRFGVTAFATPQEALAAYADRQWAEAKSRRFEADRCDQRREWALARLAKL